LGSFAGSTASTGGVTSAFFTRLSQTAGGGGGAGSQKSTPSSLLSQLFALLWRRRQPDCRWWRRTSHPLTGGATSGRRTRSSGRQGAQQFPSGSHRGQPAAGVAMSIPTHPGAASAQWMGSRWQSLVNFAKQFQIGLRTTSVQQLDSVVGNCRAVSSAGLRALQGANDVVLRHPGLRAVLRAGGTPMMQTEDQVRPASAPAVRLLSAWQPEHPT